MFNSSPTFELDPFYAALNWINILNKPKKFRTAFDHFDCKIATNNSEGKIQQLLYMQESFTIN
ncbi:DNA-3-methyladenine glycosylase I [Flavobacterium sp. Arc3]|uniref:DNA-3-methyladenine glycosylase I n=1 Tax=Flavobacterium sp. Arc3 TaxID=3046686 RepID=UPI00352D78E0